MATDFKMGSITEIVNSPTKKAGKIPSDLKKTQTEELIVVKQNGPDKPLVTSKKRKIVDIVPETETKEATSEAHPSKAEKRKKRHNNKTTTTNAVSETSNSEDSDGKESKEKEEVKPDKMARTLFVGNLPSDVSVKVRLSIHSIVIYVMGTIFYHQNLKKTMSQFGNVATIRIRGIAPAKLSLSKKAAYLS